MGFRRNALHLDFAFPFAGRFVIIRWDARVLGDKGAGEHERIGAR